MLALAEESKAYCPLDIHLGSFVTFWMICQCDFFRLIISEKICHYLKFKVRSIWQVWCSGTPLACTKS